ncbi:hypothetical protein [Pseudomonas sp. 8 R 14]|nr:hypothetical protein [Pseudomonas sp. 8 R 14]
MGQAVGLAVQLAITQGLRIELDRHRSGVFGGAVGNHFVYQTLGREAGVSLVPQLPDVSLLILAQQVELADGLLLVGNHRLQQVLPMAGHALDGQGVEQVGRVTQGGPDAVGAFMHIQVQVEMGGLALPFQAFDAQCGQREFGAAQARFGLVVEHHLEQRVKTQTALGLQRLHQLFERQVLMVLGFQRTLADLLQQLRDRSLLIDIGLEHLGVDEEADQPLGLDPVAVGNRHPDAHVFLAAVTVHQRLERGQQQHEQGHAFALRQALEVGNQRGRQLDKQARTTMALLGRALVVERQFQHRLLAAQQTLPVRKLPGFFARVHPLALPAGIVGVLDRQGRQLQIQALAVGAVQLHQLIDHDLHRPAVGDDMVQHQHQYMLVLALAQQRGPEQWPGLQVERAGDLGLHLGLEPGRVALDQNDVDRGLRRNHLHGLLITLMQMGAQTFVARYQHVEAALQRVQVQLALEAQRAGHMVGGAVGLQQPEEPLALLGVRQHQGHIAGRRHQRRRRRTALLALAVQGRDKAVEARLFEQHAQRQLDPQVMPQARRHLHGQQGMPAHLKEMIGQANTFSTEDIRPDRGNLLLQHTDRRHPTVQRLARIRAWQGMAIQLAIGAQRQCLQEHEVRRHHVVRQLIAQSRAKLLTQCVLPGLGHGGNQVGDQLLVGSNHQRFADRILGQQARFDFTQFDTEATHLDLMVDAPDVLDHTIGTVARQVAGAVQATAASGVEGVGNKAFGGQRCAVEVPPRQQWPADHQFAGHAHRHRVEAGIQQVDGAAVQYATNRHHLRDGFAAIDITRAIEGRDRNSRLGGAVGVEQAHMAQAGIAPGSQTFRRHGFATRMHLAQPPIVPHTSLGKVPGNQVPVGSGEVDHRNLMFDQLGVEGVAIPQLAATHHHRGPAAERRVELLDETVEVECTELQHAVSGGQRKHLGKHLDVACQRSLVDAHALGPPGRTRGEHQVGQVGRERAHLGVTRRVLGQPLRIGLQADQRQVGTDRQALQQGMLGQQQLQAAVFDHALQAVAGVLRVQRYIGAAGLEHGQQGHDHFQRTVHGHADQAVGAHALFDQGVGQAVGALVEVGVTHAPLIHDQSDGVGPARHLLLEFNQHAAVGGTRGLRRVPLIEHLRLLIAAQHRQVGDTLPGRAYHALQQVLPMRGEALQGTGVEQCGRVGQRSVQALGRLLGVQAQVEMRRMAVPLQPLHLQPRQLLAATVGMGVGLVIEHHLEQRVVAQAALGLQGLDQLFERQVLMGLRPQRMLLDLLQQLGKGHVPVDLGLEHLGIDEEADQLLGFQAVTVGDRHADTDVRLAGVAVQHRLEGREQQHEHGHAFALRQGAQALDHGRFDQHIQARTFVTLYRRARAVQRQLQYRLHIPQAGPPVGQLPGFFARLHPATLPLGVVRVLNRQQRQHWLEPLAVTGIQTHQFIDHDLHRPGIRHDVVLDQYQHMLALAQLQQFDAQ